MLFLPAPISFQRERGRDIERLTDGGVICQSPRSYRIGPAHISWLSGRGIIWAWLPVCANKPPYTTLHNRFKKNDSLLFYSITPAHQPCSFGACKWMSPSLGEAHQATVGTAALLHWARGPWPKCFASSEQLSLWLPQGSQRHFSPDRRVPAASGFFRKNCGVPWWNQGQEMVGCSKLRKRESETSLGEVAWVSGLPLTFGVHGRAKWEARLVGWDDPAEQWFFNHRNF